MKDAEAGCGLMIVALLALLVTAIIVIWKLYGG